MTPRHLVDILTVGAGVVLIAVGIFDLHPDSPRWVWIVGGVVLLVSKGVRFYLNFSRDASPRAGRGQ